MALLNIFEVILLLSVIECKGHRYEQSHAHICQVEPSVFSDVKVVTLRRRRGLAYTTDFEGTLRQTIGNNVSFSLSFNVNGMLVEIKKKLCDIEQEAWLADFWKTYSGEKFVCPLTPRRLKLTGMVFPPRNFPVSILGDTRLLITFLWTNTKEVLLQTSVNVKVH